MKAALYVTPVISASVPAVTQRPAISAVGTHQYDELGFGQIGFCSDQLESPQYLQAGGSAGLESDTADWPLLKSKTAYAQVAHT